MRTWERARRPGSPASSPGWTAAHAATPGYKTLTLIETTAGQGTALGYRFEQLQAMLAGCRQPERVGFCFDTCHVFAAGYDHAHAGNLLDDHGRVRPAGRARAGQVLPLQRQQEGAGVARGPARPHRHRTCWGWQPFGFILNDPRFAAVPMILETPKSEDMHEDVENLRVLRSLVR